jgi:amidase
MEVMITVTMSACPALAVPAGFNRRGLPMGLQIVGPPQDDFACLQLAQAYDEATGWVRKRRPALIGGQQAGHR